MHKMEMAAAYLCDDDGLIEPPYVTTIRELYSGFAVVKEVNNVSEVIALFKFYHHAAKFLNEAEV